MVRFSLVVVEKFKKGTNVRTLGTFESEKLAQQQRSSIKFVGKRGQPFVIPESEVAAFKASRRTGIFKPSFDPVKAREEEAAKIRRQKEQEKFERERAAAKEPGRKGEIARQLLASKAGIITADPELTQKQFIESRTLQQLLKGTTATFAPGAAMKIAGFEEFKAEQAMLRAEEIFTRQDGRAVQEFPTGFVPTRPISPQETIQLPIVLPESLEERTLFDIGGELQPAFRQQDFIFRDEITGGELAGLQAQAEVQRSGTLARQLGTGGVAAFEAELILTGIPKAIEATPEVLAFGALSFVFPPAAFAVGTVALATSIPGLQEEIATKGLLRTTASELPTITAFTVAGGAGARLRTTTKVRAAEFDITLERLTVKDIDPTFTFQKKPFAIISEGKPPAFLQRTISGDVITPSRLEFLLKDVKRRADLTEPTTIKELRQLLGQRERAAITKEQAAQLDIFRPEIEEFLLAEKGRAGLVTPEKLGIKTRQLQLRETFPTPEQKATFLLSQLPRIETPTTQATLFDIFGVGLPVPIGRFEPSFKIGEVFRGAGEGLRGFGRAVPDLPRIARADVAARAGLGFFPSISAGIFTDVDTDQILQQRTGQLEELISEPAVIQTPIQQQQPLIDVDILQIPISEVSPIQDVFLEQIQIQRTKQIALLVEAPLLDFPLDTFPRVPKKPKEPKKPRTPFALFGGEERAIAPPGMEGFDVIIREKGQDIEFDKKKSFPRQRAKNIGANIVDNSAAASFRIRRSRDPIDSVIDDGFFFLSNKFRSPATKSKLPPKQFIEKSLFRIDSAGERAGITAKGLIALKKKAMRNEFGFTGGFEL